MKSHKKYPKYKNSGIKWLGEIPEHWEVKRLKYCVELRNDKADGRNTDLLFLGLENIESWTGKQTITNDVSSSEGQVNRFFVGDILFGKLRPYLAKVLRTSFQGTCTGELLVLKPKSIIQDILFYNLLTRDFIGIVDSSTYGVKMPRANWEFIGNLPLPLPKENEQKAIAEFLDRETGKIDALIEKKEKQIELLTEERAAVISHAVTKGINPNAKMKSSGIPWFGDIPEHWEVRRLKYIASINDDTLNESTYPDYEILYVDISSVDSVLGILKKEEMSFENAPSRARRKVRNGDIIISTVRTYLRAIAPIINPEPNLIVSTGFAVIHPKNEFQEDFASYTLRSPYFVETIVARSVGVSYPAVNASGIADLKLAIPPLNEQEAIGAFLRKQLAKIDALATEIRKSISVLQEYRTVIISASVTGKIDVRKISI